MSPLPEQAVDPAVTAHIRRQLAAGNFDGAARQRSTRGRAMRVLSLFSGAGGLDLGLEAAGMTIVGHCEIDRAARQVLRRQWPLTPLHDDVTTLDPEEFRGRVDLVAGGSPCQDLSVAGRRGGLDGARSGLFWHQCRVADSVAAPWVLWENVVGVFSSNGGADFAAVLWGLTGTLPDVPDGGWRTAGVVVGPKRTAVWRLLDARWFGVAQRRRRVFVVAGPRGVCGPEVLLEPEGVRGDSEPSGEAGEVVAALTANGVGAGGGPDDNAGQAGHLIPFRMQAFGQYVDDDTTSAVKARDHKDATDLVLSFHMLQDPSAGDPSPALGAKSNGMGVAVPPASAAYPLAMRGREDGAELEMGEAEVYNALRAGNGGSSRANTLLTPELEVRRLTPRECERLMGWPDDHTRWTDTGQEIADSHRYRMCGNGVVAPVTRWIAQRLMSSAAAS